MISITIFLAISLVAVLLFIGGLAMVYYGHTLGFMANILSVVMLWSMTALSAFGSVGDIVYNNVFSYEWKGESGNFNGLGGSTVEAITNLVDPALVYLSLFTSILCTVVLIIIMVRFVMDNIVGKNPEMEDESV